MKNHLCIKQFKFWKRKDVVLTENDQDPLLNEASKENSPKQRVKVEHISTKKKKANSESKER